MAKSQVIDIALVKIHPEGDGISGLYLNGDLLLSGDAYHEDITARIEGAFVGMMAMGWDGKYRSLEIDEEYGEEWVRNGLAMPELLREFDFYKHEKFKNKKFKG